MRPVAKYNVFKSVSTLATVGTPIITLCLNSEFFVHRSETAISAAGMFTLFISLLFLKDKIAENFKVPSAFVVSLVGLILISMIENLLMPMKSVCIATMITSGVDELTFKRFYKSIESAFPENCKPKKLFGFIITSSEKLGV